MQYQGEQDELIEEAAIDRPRRRTMSVDMETECADAIMDGCAEELRGINLANVTTECRARIVRTLEGIMGDDYREDTLVQ